MIEPRATLIALLAALLEPVEILRKLETDGDFTARLAMLESLKNLPVGAVWDYYCAASEVPVGAAWLDLVRRYEREVLSRRATFSTGFLRGGERVATMFHVKRWSSEFGVRSSEFGVRSSEFGVRSSEFGVWSVRRRGEYVAHLRP